MNADYPDRVAGMLFGAFCADALALGAHWIYDPAELERTCGRVTDFRDPQPDSYHPTKLAGQQTHYGDQALTLLDSIAVANGFQAEAFAKAWAAMWPNYADYVDHATKDTRANMERQGSLLNCASDSDELGGASRGAPLLAWMASGDLEAAILAARAQANVTHGAELVGDAAEFLTRTSFALLAGETLPAALEQAGAGVYVSLDLPAMQEKVAALDDQPLQEAAATLGLSCPAPKALPTLLLLLRRHGDDLETALIENVMIGGDNAARGMALGLLLGAAGGVVPERWRAALAATPRLEAFLQQRAARSL